MKENHVRFVQINSYFLLPYFSGDFNLTAKRHNLHLKLEKNDQKNPNIEQTN